MSGVIGRDSELDLIADFVRCPPGNGGGLVLVGEPGIGKTTLWLRGVELAQAGALQVLSCRAAEAESELALTAIADLCTDAAEDWVLAELPAPQRRALRVALLQEEPEGPAAPPRVLAQAVLELLRRLSERTPMLLAIDDLHWLDASSSRVLGYVLRRLDGLSISVLASLRVTPGLPPAPHQFADWTATGAVRQLRLGPLSLAALHRLVRERLGASFTHPMLARLALASGGNPFYALEIARLVAHGGTAAELGVSLPVPRDLRETVVARLATLPEQAREAVLAGYALARPTEELIEADLRLAGLPADGLALAVRGQALDLGSEGVRLVHPLLGSASYAELTAAERRALHGRLAGIVAEPVESARHLAMSTVTPSSGVASVLERAAEVAARRGAPDGAAELFELAIRLTPEADEADRLRRSDQAALAYQLSGDAAKAASLWSDLSRTAPAGALRARAVWRLVEYGAATVDAGFETAPEMLEAVVDEAAAEPCLQIDVLASLAEFRIWGRGPSAADAPARRAVALAERCVEPRPRVHALVSQALVDFYSGRGDPDGLLASAAALEEEVPDLPVEIRPSAYRGYMAAWIGDAPAEAARRLAECIAAAQRENDESSLPVLLWHCCEAVAMSGDLDAAGSYAAWCQDAVATSGRSGRRGVSVYCQALVEFQRGRSGVARELARNALDIDEPRGVGFLVALFRGLLGAIEVADGRFAQAVEWMQPVHAALLAAGHAEPAIFKFVPDHVEALIGLGRTGEAGMVLQPYEASARRLGRRAAEAGAARARGLLLAAGGDSDAAMQEMGRSVVLEAQLGRRFQQARALLAAGGVARRARHRGAADDALRQAVELFLDMGATGWADRAASERGRVGIRAAAAGSLTETDRRIAALVAEGLSNPAIAGALFMSRKTVEAHLSDLYRKLGIASRAELAARAAGLQDALGGVGEET